MKRTGIIFSSTRNQLKKGLLGWFASALEKVGKPFYWLVVIVFSGLALILSLIAQPFLSLLSDGVETISKFFTSLPKKLRTLPPKIKAPRPIKVARPRRQIVFHLRLPKITFRKALLAALILLVLYTGAYFLFNFLYSLPNPDELVTRRQIVSTKIYDRNGELLYKVYRNENRTLIKLEDIPLQLIQATIAIEDAEFYYHHGFSPKAIFRAFVQNLEGEKLYGGSTITQQLVKNALLGPERTISRKIKELILAVAVESKLSKDEILQMYLNEVGYGGAAYGVEEASEMYFGKPVKDLNLAEAALLAGIPASPSIFSPFAAYPEKAKERQELVLNRMAQEGFITQEQAEDAKLQELKFAAQKTDIKAPHFVMYVKELLAAEYGEQMVEEGGLEVKTSLDLKTQEMAQQIVSREVKGLASLRISNGAALVTNPQTGEILAMVGSKDYFNLKQDGNVNVTLRPRQPGSSIKIITYSLALQNGYTAATIIPDTPVSYQAPNQPTYSPKNYDNRFHGNVPLRIAFASSYNVPAVKVLNSLGVNKMIDQAEKMGITTWTDRSRFGLSLTLGGGEVKMTDMAVAYGTLANMGEKVALRPILEVKDYKGKVLPEFKAPKPTKVLDPRIAFILDNILSDNSARTPAFGPSSWLNISNHPSVAVKTGTTQNLRDNWTIGYTPDYLVAVWVGNNDNKPMSYVASGITGASPIWNKIMTNLIAKIPDKQFPKPEDILEVEICPSTGTLPCQGCGGKKEYFLPGSEPEVHCTAPQPTPTP
jgi:1A family penicillin-binding protein